MIYNWYKIINRPAFEATGLPSRELSIILSGIGLVAVRVVRGRLFSIVYKNVMLSVGMSNLSPFAFEGYAVYQDSNGDVWLGIATP